MGRATASTSIASTGTLAPSRTSAPWRAGGPILFLAVNANGRAFISCTAIAARSIPLTIDPARGTSRRSTSADGGYNPVHLASMPPASSSQSALWHRLARRLPDRQGRQPAALRHAHDGDRNLGPHRHPATHMCVHISLSIARAASSTCRARGPTSVIAYRLDTRRRILVEAARVTARPGAAPRHIDFHPRKALPPSLTNSIRHSPLTAGTHKAAR